MQQSVIFGNSQRIITETTFTLKNFDDYCEDEEIERVAIVTGIPGNGQVEHINRIIIPVLTKLTTSNPTEWHKHVDKTTSIRRLNIS